jgi:carbamoyl-phosphate synthase large subunit
MKKRILISGLGGSLFPYLHFKIIEAGYDPYYVDSNPILKNIYPEMNLFIAPSVSHEGYKEFIIQICKIKKIEVYIPLIDEELITAIEIGKEIEKLIVLTPSFEFTSLCLDKFQLMKKLKEIGISTNITIKGDEFNWQFPSPVFVKPNIGRGSRGIRKIINEKQLDAYYILENYTSSEVIIQPFINGTEYTVGVVVNSQNQIISISPKKVIQKKGITISAVTENNNIIIELANKINDKLKPKGPFNMQLFLQENFIPVIFEINPRFSTTLVLSYEAGIDEVSLLIDNYEKNVVQEKKAIENIFLYRHWNNSFYRKE